MRTVGDWLNDVVLLTITQWLATLPWPLWLTSITIFVVAWIGQFIGHAIEGKRPSFFKDLQFLLIGPLWLLAAAYRKVGLSYLGSLPGMPPMAAACTASVTRSWTVLSSGSGTNSSGPASLAMAAAAAINISSEK